MSSKSIPVASITRSKWRKALSSCGDSKRRKTLAENDGSLAKTNMSTPQPSLNVDVDDDNDEEEYNEDDDSVGVSDDDLSNTSGEDNSNPDDLDYYEEQEEDLEEDHRPSSSSEDDTETSFSETSSRFTVKRKAAETELIVERTKECKKNLSGSIGLDGSATMSESKKFDILSSEMHFSMVSEFGSTSTLPSMNNPISMSSRGSPSRVRRRSWNEMQILLFPAAGYQRYATTFYPCGKYERQFSGIMDSSIFDGLQCEDSNRDIPSIDHSAHIEGIVWGIIPDLKRKLYPHQHEDRPLVRRMVKLMSWKSDGGILGISYNLFVQLAGKDIEEKQKCPTVDKHVSNVTEDGSRIEQNRN
ncbi:hypothetical protein F3Y22_tig00111129pilonHSYRG00117 [Hibiscus syriacus]|uniref:Uncharacterized protein n=1 Tax=Hibiscus syriacus TaxID=106335 RepID=A0A6A2YY67_HIBSY|nr:hypothetical protein F3Y22_tig00111129pilonHSYRG00117 [Hibiscus syriacus]